MEDPSRASLLTPGTHSHYWDFLPTHTVTDDDSPIPLTDSGPDILGMELGCVGWVYDTRNTGKMSNLVSPSSRDSLHRSGRIDRDPT